MQKAHPMFITDLQMLFVDSLQTLTILFNYHMKQCKKLIQYSYAISYLLAWDDGWQTTQYRSSSNTTTNTTKLLDKHYLPITVAGMRAVTVSWLGTNPFTWASQPWHQKHHQ